MFKSNYSMRTTSCRKVQNIRHTSKIIIQFYKHIHFIALFRCHINLLAKLQVFFSASDVTLSPLYGSCGSGYFGTSVKEAASKRNILHDFKRLIHDF